MTATVAIKESESKAERALYGVLGKPIAVTKVLQASFKNFSSSKTKAEIWILINEKAGTVIFANSYDGNLGKRFNPVARTLDSLESEKHKKRMKDFKEVPKSKWPEFVTSA